MELMRLRVKVIDADRMAAIIDDMVRGRHLDARSKLSDARLDYGQPFNPTGMRQGAEMLATTRMNADYWLTAGRDTPDCAEAVLAVEQSANAWKNAAYALAEKLSKATLPEERESNELEFLKRLLTIIHPANGMLEPMTEDQSNAEEAIIARVKAIEARRSPQLLSTEKK